MSEPKALWAAGWAFGALFGLFPLVYIRFLKDFYCKTAYTTYRLAGFFEKSEKNVNFLSEQISNKFSEILKKLQKSKILFQLILNPKGIAQMPCHSVTPHGTSRVTQAQMQASLF